MKKISIKKFCKEYSNRATEQLKEQYLDENLKITPYVPFVTKDAVIDKLLDITMFDKETQNVKLHSSGEYLLLTRVFIEQYTNLSVETEGFYEEYDELKKSGLFDVLLVGDEKTNTPPLIPYDEIVEFKYLLSIKKSDILTNYTTPQAFISQQVERFGKVANISINPIIDAVKEKVKEIPKEDLNKLIEFAKAGGFKEVQ
jgi:hypothetical protein